MVVSVVVGSGSSSVVRRSRGAVVSWVMDLWIDVVSMEVLVRVVMVVMVVV